MFESLSDKLQSVFDRLSSKGKLTESDVNVAMREVRLALLEADVNYKVVKEFVDKVKERSIGAEVMQSLTPAQTVVKIVHEELIELLGKPAPLNTSGQPPTVIMLVGLQGAGKTTMAAKLALRLRKNGQRPLLVAADIYRPAAIKQLEVLGKQIDVPVHAEGTDVGAATIAKNAVKLAREKAYTDCPDRHRRPPADRRRPHAGTGTGAHGVAPCRHPARRRRHDRPGSRQCRRGL